MMNEHVFDLLPAYALGALDEEDLLKVSRHLPHCDLCRSELASYSQAVDQIAIAAPLRSPPGDLRARVLQRVAQKTTRPVGAAAPEVVRPGFFSMLRSFLSGPVGWVAVGAALLLVIFLAVNNVLLWQRMNQLQARVPANDIQIVQLQGTNAAPQTVGYMMVFKNDNYGTLAVENAPDLPPGHQYQVWLIKDGKRTNGGVFSVNESGYGVLEIIADQPLDRFQSFGITVEPAGGSPQPTGTKILGGKL